MGNLVNRLRGQYPIGPDGTYGTRSFADFIPPISLEAANRIEELESALRQIGDTRKGINGDCDIYHIVKDVLG